MTEIKLTKRYPQSRTEDIVDAYMRGWNDALDAVQNGKFIINEAEQTEPQTEKSKIRKRNDKPFRAVWLDDDYNEIGTPQTERSE